MEKNVKFDGIRRRTWAKINLDNARHNYREIKKHTDSKICCVVKANGYGHNAVKLASVYQEIGADFWLFQTLKKHFS